MKNIKKIKKTIAGVISVTLAIGCVNLTSFSYASDVPAMQDMEFDNTTSDTRVVTATKQDTMVIPDANNTGSVEPEGGYVKMDGDKIPCKLNGEDTYIESAPRDDGSITLNLQYAHKSLDGHYVFENLDLSENSLRVYNVGVLKEQGRNITFEFINCSIKSYSGDRRAYDNIKYIFTNCTFVSASGSNITFESCKFGGGINDRMNVFVNCDINNCYIYNPTSYFSADGEIHVDGVQMYGYKDSDGVTYPTENVYFNNCRFEMPAVPYKNAPKAYVNACIMLQTEFSDGNNIYFENCYVNGGGYAVYVHGVKGTHLSNITLKNITFGCASKYGRLYPDKPKEDDVEWNEDTWEDANNIYVGSVTRDKAKNETYLTVSNDTNKKKYFRVYTSNGNHYDYEIEACPTNKELNDKKMLFEEMPLDVVYTVPEYCEYAVVYEMIPVANSTKADMVQVRFANWTDKKSVTIDDVSATTISYELVDGVMTINGFGEMPEYDSVEQTPWYGEKEKVKKIIINGITTVSKSAFLGYTNLLKVVIDKKTTIIEEAAFKDCYELKSINLNESLELVEIGAQAFANCASMSKVMLPESLLKVGANAYSIDKDIMNCREYTDIYYSGSLEKWLKISFATSYSEPRASSNPQAEIGGKLYVEGNKLVTELDCSNMTGKVIGGAAFAGCKSLKKVNLESVKEIGADAFENSGVAGDIIITDTITRIGVYAFACCENVKKVIWESATAVPMGCFIECSGIKTLDITGDIEVINNWAFRGCTSLESVKLNDKIKEIRQQSFSADKSIKDINLPSSLTKLGNYAFSGCENITEIVLPKNANSFDLAVFMGCTSLEKVVITESVNALSKSMFANCTALKTVEFKGETCPTIQADTFKGITNSTISFVIPARATGYGESEVIGKVAEHIFECKYVEAKSCTEAAKDIYTCIKHDKCNANKTIMYDALPHVKANAVKENIVNATITKTGSYDEVVYCKECKKELSRKKITINKKKITVKTVSIKNATSKITKKKVAVKKKGVKKYITKKYKTLTVTWKKQSGVTGYIVKYSTSKNMKKGVHTKKIKSKKACKTTINKLNSKKKYWVRVRAYRVVNGKTYYGKWSKVKKA